MASRGPAARAVELSVAPHLIIDEGGHLVTANRSARTLLGLAEDDVGRALGELDPGGLASLLATAVGEAAGTRATVVRRAVAVGEAGRFDVHAVPLGDGASHGAVLLAFVDVTAAERTQSALDESNEVLARLDEELDAANDQLQATVHELQSTNEELRASNAELEVMNEELAAANVELSAIKVELDRRTAEADRMSAFLGSIIDGLAAAVVVVDVDQRVRAWNEQASRLWDRSRGDVLGRPLAQLDLHLPMEVVTRPVRSMLAGEGAPEPRASSLDDDEGRPVTVTYAPLRGSDGTVEGAVLIVASDSA